MNKLVLIGGPDENVTQPWQSALYTFTDKNYSLVPFKESELYTQDQFGLKTLDDQGKIQFCNFSGVHHTHWPKTKEVYKKGIKPYIE